MSQPDSSIVAQPGVAAQAAAPWRALYPFAPHELRLGGLRYHYLDEGAGPTVLAVHGNPTWSFYFRTLVESLRGELRWVVPDHMGCGLSDKPAQYPYRLATHIDNLRRLVVELDLRDVTLVAHDWGGAIGLGTLLLERARFSRIVLFNTGAFRSSRMPWRIAACRIPLLGRLAVQGANAFARAALRMATEKPERFTPAVRAGYLAPYDTWAHRQAIYRFVQDIPMSPGDPSYARLVEIEEGLPSLADLPALLIWGMRDWCFTPAFLARFEEYWPRAETLELADAGHYVVEDAYERIVPRLREFVGVSAGKAG